MSEETEHLKSDQDVEEILRMAIRKSGVENDELRRRLEISAQELGISESDLKAAEEEYRRQITEGEESKLSAEQDLNDWKEWRQHKLHDFYSHLGIYAVVNIMLIFMNLLSSGRISWALWSIAGWGIGVAVHGVNTAFTKTEENVKDFKSWQRKKRKRKKTS